jgi:hypothetical protein
MTAPALTCEVCGDPAIGVASSSLGPISFAYCAECSAVGAEPYDVTIAFVAETCGRTPVAVAAWFLPVIEATAQRSGRTVEQFWADVAAHGRPKTLPPWWEYRNSEPLDLWSLPRPGDPDWQDPINPYDLGPLSDEPEAP